MILWKESLERPERHSLLRAARLGFATFGSAAAIFLSVIHFHGHVRPGVLASAGKIELKRMIPAVSVNTVLPAAEGRSNAAAHYVDALSSYAKRRIPYLKGRGFKAFVNEPPVTAEEVRLLELGSLRAVCDFYEARKGRSVFVLKAGVDSPWAFRRALDPTESRPYVTPLRLLLVGVMYKAEEMRKAGRTADAAWLYALVVRVGAHLFQRPGCLLDAELGIEMQLMGLNRLCAVYGAQKHRDLAKATAYRSAVKLLSERIRRKYGQLDNPEAAAVIATKDEDPVWRIEAVASLRRQEKYHALGFLERRVIAASLDRLAGTGGRARATAGQIARLRRPAPKN